MDQVEGLVDLGKFFQDVHHPVVILERVHARPGELVLAESKVLRKRLVQCAIESTGGIVAFITRASGPAFGGPRDTVKHAYAGQEARVTDGPGGPRKRR